MESPVDTALEVEDVIFEVTEEEQLLNEIVDLKKCDIETLREWLTTQKHLPEISDTMLIMFLHSRTNDLPKTMSVIDNYYTMRTKIPEFFTDRDMTSPDLVLAAEVLYIAALPTPDPNGYPVSYYGLRDTDPDKFILSDAVKLMFMTYDATLMKYGTAPGFHAIFDMRGAKFKHLTRMGLSVLKNYILFGERALPISREIVHMVNVSTWVDKLMMLVKPWMSKETSDNIHYYATEDLESLHKYIPQECLPKELGGSLESVEDLHAANCRTLESLSEYFAEEEKMRVDESKRAKKKSSLF